MPRGAGRQILQVGEGAEGGGGMGANRQNRKDIGQGLLLPS